MNYQIKYAVFMDNILTHMQKGAKQLATLPTCPGE